MQIGRGQDIFLAAYTAVNQGDGLGFLRCHFLAAYTAVNWQKRREFGRNHFLAAYTAVNRQKSPR